MILLRKKSFATAAVAAVISAGVSVNAVAAKAPPMEKCYGIVKAGKNDCGASGGNACAGQSKVNSDPHAWIFVPKGTCDKIVGASSKPPAKSASGDKRKL